MTDRYADIIDLPHYEPQRHPRMSASARAAQFAPFAALTGYDAAIEETARQTDPRLEPEADSLADLDRKMAWLRQHAEGEPPLVAVTYFRPDARKEGGAYLSHEGRLKGVDPCGGLLLFADGAAIPLRSVLDLTGEVFDGMEDPAQ